MLVLTQHPSAVVVAESEQHNDEYGVDISFPMHYAPPSTNYAWLPHNVDPQNNPTPPEYKDMPIQPLGDMDKKYNDYIQGCVEFLWI